MSDQRKNWGVHLFECAYCDLSDSSNPRFCPEGERAAKKLVLTPKVVELLVAAADEWVEEEYHRAAVRRSHEPYVWSLEELAARERQFMDAKLS